jgi:hypothetical protein
MTAQLQGRKIVIFFTENKDTVYHWIKFYEKELLLNLSFEKNVCSKYFFCEKRIRIQISGSGPVWATMLDPDFGVKSIRINSPVFFQTIMSWLFKKHEINKWQCSYHGTGICIAVHVM